MPHALDGDGFGMMRFDPVLQPENRFVTVIAMAGKNGVETFGRRDQQMSGAQLCKLITTLLGQDLQQGIETTVQCPRAPDIASLQEGLLGDKLAGGVALLQLPYISPVRSQQPIFGKTCRCHKANSGGHCQQAGSAPLASGKPGQHIRLGSKARSKAYPLNRGNDQQIVVVRIAYGGIGLDHVATGRTNLRTVRGKHFDRIGLCQAQMLLKQGDDAEKIRCREYPHAPTAFVGQNCNLLHERYGLIRLSIIPLEPCFRSNSRIR